MKAIISISVFALLTALAALGCVTGGGDGAPEQERRAHELNKTIMCPLCPGESIDQSQNPLSVQMRAVVSEKIAEGWTDDEIRDFFVERYGPTVLMEPPTEGMGLVAWLVPPIAVAVVVGGMLGVFIWVARPLKKDVDEGGLEGYRFRVHEVVKDLTESWERELYPDADDSDGKDDGGGDADGENGDGGGGGDADGESEPDERRGDDDPKSDGGERGDAR